MKPARGESCPPGQRRGSAAPREDKFPSPHQKPLLISKIITTRGRKRRSPGRYRPAWCGNSNPTGWLLIGRGSWSQRVARVASLAEAEVPRHPGRIGSHPWIRNRSISPQLTPTTWGRKRGSHGSILPRTVWKPQPNWLVADWLGLVEPADGESCLSGQGRGCAAHGEVNAPSPDQKSFHNSTIPTHRGQDGDLTGRYRLTQCGNSNSGYAIVDWGS